jgi:hypothetical protein
VIEVVRIYALIAEQFIHNLCVDSSSFSKSHAQNVKYKTAAK